MKRLSDQVIGCAIEVSKSLRNGFLERVYANALAIELTTAGIEFAREWPISVMYKGQVVGDYCADFFVARKLIVEIKAVESLQQEHQWQVLNYLRATDTSVGLLLNFGGKKLEVKRVVLDYSDDQSI